MTKGAVWPPSAIALFCLLLAPAAVAQPPEGLVNPSLAPQPDSVLQLAEQDVYLSTEAVTIRLLLRNPTGHAVRESLLLPLPDRDLAAERDRPVHLPRADMDDFLGVRLVIDDRAATPQTEVRTFLQDRDVTGQLQRQGVPVTSVLPLVERGLDALMPSRREFLESRGLIEGLHPLWTVRVRLSWDIDVPANASRRVELRYTPSRYRDACEIGDACRRLLQVIDEPGRCRPSPDQAHIERLEKRAKDDKVGQFLAEEMRFTAQPWPTPPAQLHLRADRLGRDNPLHLCGGITSDTLTLTGALPPGETRFGIVRVIPKAEAVAR